MRTHLEFRSSAFPAAPGEDEEINPGRYGKRLASYLGAALPRFGFDVVRLGAEDWGWRIDLRNDAFPLWVGCGNYEEFDDGFLCLIEPSRPTVRRWLTRISTRETVERLGSAIEQALNAHGAVGSLRWWDEGEAEHR